MANIRIQRLCALAAAIVMLMAAASGAPTARAQDEPGVITNSIGMKLARIPAGAFMMGSPPSEPERDKTETLHEVVITEPFYMGVHEVTQAEYMKVLSPDKNPAVFRQGRGGGPDHPVEDISWKNAVEFCKALSERPEEQEAGRVYRLPTEAEWEHACRAGTTTAFHYGDSLSSHQANFNGRHPYGDAEKGPYLRRTEKVGAYEPNAFGLYDMHGNVAELCADWYDPNYYENSPVEDPLGPPFGVLKSDFGEFYVVVRGGCWLDDGRACRSAYRFRAMPKTNYRLIGFRVVCELEKDAQAR